MKEIYIKAMLYAYPHVGEVCDQLDEVVLSKALSSMSNIAPCEEQCQKILALTEQKLTVMEVKEYVDKVISKLTEHQKMSLEYKYFKRRPKEYYKDFDFTSRNFYRNQPKIIAKINKILTQMGVDDIYFESKCLPINFFNLMVEKVRYLERLHKAKAEEDKEQKEKVVCYS